MFSQLASKIFGTKNDRELKRMGKIVQSINELEQSLENLSEDQFIEKTQALKERYQANQNLDDLLPEAFALVREAGKRTLGLRHFDVQLIGGITLHEGRIAEMRTGEGKTLVATLPAYLNALSSNAVHIVTVNDYLAKRDAEWMRPLYEFLGLTVGVVVPNQDSDTKRQAYSADITYGTNNEFGFDYLRDNMAFSLEERAQRDLNFAIVDEVDSILIDEARTPLIISGAAEDSSELYVKINKLIPQLKEQETKGDEENTMLQRLEKQTGQDKGEKEPETGHYTIDEKQRSVELTELGHELLEEKLAEVKLLEDGDSLYAAHNLNLLHHVHAALKAHILFKRDVEYIVQDKQIVIIDEHTGRTMPGRRWSEGIHQAVEAKENVPIQNESQTLASTTFQNYFRIYNKLSGMTGTADTEAFEFRQIYGLDVVVIPTNKPMIRDDQNDLVFLSQDEKFDAIIEDIKDCKKRGQPVLVGTASIDTSERVSKLLKKEKIPHNVLNAKRHAQEAEVIAQAGRPGTVTIATNMAGRGTDIVLGGSWQAEIEKLKNPSEKQIEKIKADWEVTNKKILEAGGLVVIGSERHESRRIDNQLRGRSGRQGDAGRTRFYLSLEDDLMRIFASDRIKNLMRSLGMENGEAIEHRMVSNAIEKAQRKVEGRNFDIRKNLLEYDDVANEQRQIIYQQRNELMVSEGISETLVDIRHDVINDAINEFIPPQSIEDQWDVSGLEQHLANEFACQLPIQHWLDEDDDLHEDNLRTKIIDTVESKYQEKSKTVGAEMQLFEKQIMLQIIDSLWKEHLAQMDFLRQGIHLRAYAQKQPKQEYKRESFHLFQDLLRNINHQTVRFLCQVEIQRQDEAEELERRRREAQANQRMQYHHEEASALEDGETAPADGDENSQQTPFVREGRKVGRNEPCPCGSGKKFKLCHGKLA